ncbi:MAG: ABC transporter ATP-binding protein [Methanomassiliicoccales archaeon]
MVSSILETKNLTFQYPNGTLALDDVSIKIPEGKKTVILGSNGSGKSTLFLHFNGVLRPKKGEIFYAGKRIEYSSRALSELRTNVSVVLQNPDDQIFSTTVEEDIAFGPMNLGLERKEIEARVDEALFLVNLQDVRERPTQQLSFGQRKRVALAGALAMKPKVLMMDEPTAGLDSRMVHELLELADELNMKGLTVIMSTHDVETAYEWADEIRVLHRGRLEFSGRPEEFFSEERKVYSLGLVTPVLFEIDRRFTELNKASHAIPSSIISSRSVQEILLRLFPHKDSKIGRLRLIKVAVQPFHHKNQLAPPEASSKEVCVGVYGTMARKWALENGMKVDYTFNALDMCVREIAMGRDFILLTDDVLMPLVQSKLTRLEEHFGIKIPTDIY